MRKPKNRTNLNPQAFKIGKGLIEPQALQRSPATTSSKRFDENTIVWGTNDSLPLEILKSVDDSPVATSCLDIRADFIKGSGFKDKALEEIVINKNGQTLWGLHCELADILAKLDGFATLHRFNSEGKITNAYYIPLEELRFVKPEEDTDSDIKSIKHNPFWGTQEYQKKFTREYPLHDLENVVDQIRELRKDFPGQVFYYGTTSPLYRFYPRPKYWSGERWIKADGKLQTFHDENLENGFFQSTLINVIGNPSQPSSNPKYQKEVTGTDGVIRRESTKTVGEEFNDVMSETFSGAKKAGTAMVMWSQNQDSTAKVQPFPTNTNSDLLSGTFTDIIRGITIATKVPGVLANLPQDGLFSASGESFQKAIELMHSRTIWQRKQLEDYYNNVLLPNLETPIEQKVEIANYQPASTPIEINEHVWDFLNDQEKAEFVKTNFSNIKLIRQEVIAPAPVAPLPTQEGVSEPQQVNNALRNLNIADLNRVQKIVARYNLSLTEPANTKAITYDQAFQLIKAFGFTDEEVNAWLVKPEEL